MNYVGLDAGLIKPSPYGAIAYREKITRELHVSEILSGFYCVDVTAVPVR